MASPMLILGTAQADPHYGFLRKESPPSRKLSFQQILERGAGFGFEAVDTAATYPGAHELIRASSWPGAIHTKIPGIRSVIEELADAQEDLGRDVLDVVYFHNSSSMTSEPAAIRRDAQQMLDSGVTEVGVSIYSPVEFEVALQMTEISVIQVPMNPLDQRYAGRYGRQAHEAGKKIIARSIFLQGSLLSSNRRLAPQLPRGLEPYISSFLLACEAHNLPPLEACLDFISRIPNLFGFIVGLDDLAQGRALMAARSSVAQRKEQSINYEALHVEDESLIDLRRWN